MSVKDGIGNDISEGDLLLVQLAHPYCIGRVSKMQDGGLSLADPTGKAKNSPGAIQILCPQTIAYAPGPYARIPVVFKLNNPVSQDLINKLTDEANAGVPSSRVAEMKPRELETPAEPPIET